MSEILANIVVQPVDLTITAENNQINITPEDIQLNVYIAGQGSGGASGNVGELQFNNNGGLGGAANTLVTANGNVSFTNISNLKIAGGNTAYFLQTDGSGNLTWAAGTANVSGNGTSAGSNNQIQLSDGTGNFKVGAGFSFDTSSNILAVPGNVAATNFIGTLANGTSNIAIATSANINLTVNGNVSAVVSDNRLTVPSLRVNSANIALGANAGSNAQTANAIAIGNEAGFNLQGANAIAIGFNAGNSNQGIEAIAIGSTAGKDSQGNSAIAIGFLAGGGGIGQGQAAVAIGPSAGEADQGEYSVAIGYRAGKLSQPNNSIIINAANATLDASTANAFYVKPVRQNNTGNVMYYNTVTGEISYDVKPDTNNINNGTSNVTIASANSNITMGVNGTANVVVVSQSGINVTGNANISGNAIITGNITATNITGNISGPLANGTSSVSIPAANGNIISNVDGTDRLIVTNAGANLTGNLTVAGNIQGVGFANVTVLGATGNITSQTRVSTPILNITTGNSLAIGFNSTTGTFANSVAIGTSARANGEWATAVGFAANASSGGGTSLGYLAGASVGSAGTNPWNTYIGAFSGRTEGAPNAFPQTGRTHVGARAGEVSFGSGTVSLGFNSGAGTDPSTGNATRGQDDDAIAIGVGAGREYQGEDAITIGAFSSANNQGVGSIVIGARAGNNAANNSITIDATNSNLSANIANALFVKPIRDVTGEAGFTVALYYNPTTGEIGYK
jgi:hypothetical protein